MTEPFAAFVRGKALVEVEEAIISWLFILYWFIDPLPSLPYFVRRSRMHNIPVYKEMTHGNRQMTLIRKVEGDIWVSALGMYLILSGLKEWGPVIRN